jgi:membrane-bound serine protease (ClpP class)
VIFLIALIVALIVLPWPWSLVLIAAGLATEGLLAAYGFRYARRWRPRVGVETLVGTEAEAITPLDPDGQVRLNGEIWRVRSSRNAEIGARVRVTAIDGLTLEVDPV